MPPRAISSPPRRRPPRYAGGSLRTRVSRSSAPDVTVPSDDPYRALFLAHPLPMWCYDPATSAIVDVNDAALAHYGVGRDAFLRKRAGDLQHEGTAPGAGGRLFDAVSQPCDLR